MSDAADLYFRSAAINAALEVAVGLHTLQPSSTDADEIATHRHIGGLLEVIRLAAGRLTMDLCAMSEDEEVLVPPVPVTPQAPALEPQLTEEQRDHARRLLQPAFEYLDEMALLKAQPEPA